jgi:hypothetical protein
MCVECDRTNANEIKIKICGCCSPKITNFIGFLLNLALFYRNKVNLVAKAHGRVEGSPNK